MSSNGLKVFVGGMSILLFAAVMPVVHAQITWYVAVDGTGQGTGGWPDATNSIQGAIDQAGAGSTVLVSNGIYSLGAEIVVAKDIYVRSWNNDALDPVNTILDGQNNTACLYINHIGAVVAGFSVINGNGVGGANNNFGGGVYIGGADDAGGTLSNCIVVANTAASEGGGIYAWGEHTLIIDSQVLTNNILNASSALGGGGGLWLREGTVRGTTLCGNRIADAGFYRGGGGICVINSGLIDACRIINNATTNQGGGIYCRGEGHIRIIDSNVSSNNVGAADDTRLGGGGISIRDNVNVDILNCVIVSNQTGSAGGGILHSAHDLTVSNTIIVDNTAFNRGGGLGLLGSGERVIEILNCRIENNTGVSLGGGMFVGECGVMVDRCIIRGNQSENDAGFSFFSNVQNRPYVIRNSLIVGNRATSNRGAGRLRYGAMMQNCTVVSNYSPSVGGLGLDADSSVFGVTSVSNSIVRYNHNDTGESNFSIANGSTVSWTCTSPISGLPWPGNLEADPLFVNADNGDYRLQPGSPCINAGMFQDWMPGTLDLVGRSRLDRFSRQVDMGCYEYISHGTLYNLR